MQEVDAERRIRQLRGLPVDELETSLPPANDETHPSSETYVERDRKRRRRAGEDDTDRDIRYAKESQSQLYEASTRESYKSSPNIPLHDTNGHINLFPEKKGSKSTSRSSRNPEAEQEKAQKSRELEDQYTMRFSNASGFKDAVDKPQWYHSKFVVDGGQETPSKNVWRDEDPQRKHREQNRMSADDPLAAIQRGVKGVRQAEQSRREWKERQQGEINEMIKQEQVERRSRKRRNVDELDGFSLDTGVGEQQRDKHRKHHRHRHRDRDRSRSPRRHHRHHHDSVGR